MWPTGPESAATIYQALIEAELPRCSVPNPMNAPMPDRQRNGHWSRTLSTTAGDLELRIPKVRAGSFFPSLLERRRRVDQALYAVMMEAYLHGVSTGRLTTWSRPSASTPGSPSPRSSRICEDLDWGVPPPGEKVACSGAGR